MCGGEGTPSYAYSTRSRLSSTMSEHEVPSSVAQRVIIRFLANEGVKSAEILTRLQAQFGDATLSRTQVFDWAKKFRSGRDAVENASGEGAPVKAKTRLSAGKVLATVFWDSRGVLLIDFLHVRKTVNAAYYCQLLGDVRAAYRNKRRSASP